MAEVRLTQAQREQLEFMASTDVVDITDESLVAPLIEKGLVLKFYETDGSASGDLVPVWTITAKGRAALSRVSEVAEGKS